MIKKVWIYWFRCLFGAVDIEKVQGFRSCLQTARPIPCCTITESQNKLLMISRVSGTQRLDKAPRLRCVSVCVCVCVCVCKVVGIASAFWVIVKLSQVLLIDTPVVGEEEDEEGREERGRWRVVDKQGFALLWLCFGAGGWPCSVSLRPTAQEGILSHWWPCGTHLIFLIFSLSSNYPCHPPGFPVSTG